MEQDAQTQQIITNLVVRSATQIADGKSRESVIDNVAVLIEP